ncbi:4-hydroxy-3-methylbut-2-en-1-yl diphosphate synthase [Sporobacter termitidis DSM 10068]|uniref:4-hydroxy-3-methylbut-2-en-1-yl diphosphate synthase (flavodoxin) n=1 Tax=Sporobacter termitidis DSM 10068 TaxID=1123282 RepID=A0A1M5VL12_9FIRM|nr:4-hydroxy-3-methylbut-2-en-1-yl diphosphate synthase [Sporobacter termitidis DSM 10068]
MIGGGAPVTVQSMTNTKTSDVAATAAQTRRLAAAGCDIVRFAVPDMAAAHAIEAIKKEVSVPIVADIHFDYRLAVAAAEAGADKIRINPGNIGAEENVRAVTDICRQKGIPIRIGVNGGSLERDILARFGGVTPEALLESAMRHVRLLNRFDFDDICISVKSSEVALTIDSYRLLSQATDYPLHLGVTEAGTEYMGIIKSSVGIGALLAEGIGDTIRVSLTALPEREVKAGIAILKALGLRESGADLISCPTCGRTKIDLIPIAEEVEKRLAGMDRPITVAVMGCAVNGPGEARRADFGIAGGDGEGVLFRRGEIVRKVPMAALVDELFKLIGESYSEK